MVVSPHSVDSFGCFQQHLVRQLQQFKVFLEIVYCSLFEVRLSGLLLSHEKKCHLLHSVPAVDEVWHWVVDAEAGGVQVSADLHIVSSHESHGCLVLLVKHLPLQRRRQQEHEVICRIGGKDDRRVAAES